MKYKKLILLFILFQNILNQEISEERKKMLATLREAFKNTPNIFPTAKYKNYLENLKPLHKPM